MKRAIRASLLIVGLMVWGCSSDPNEPDTKLSGSWGGPGASVIATDNKATLRFSCASGSVDGLITIDGEGAFEVEGTFVREAGPEPYASFPVTFRGQVSGGRMYLEVWLLDVDLSGGSYELELDMPPTNLGLCR